MRQGSCTESDGSQSDSPQNLKRIITENQSAFSGTLFMLKRCGYEPNQPSGHEGRFNLEGTAAFYLADSLEACRREVLCHDPKAQMTEYVAYEAPFSGTFVDVGLLKIAGWIRPQQSEGWTICQALASELHGTGILGFRWPSLPAIQGSTSGTCFCVFADRANLSSSDFTRVQAWNPVRDL